MKKPVVGKGNADWVSELPSVIKQYNNTIDYSIKMTPIRTFKKVNEKKIYCNHQDRRQKQKSKYQFGQLVRT